jgi:gag-polyprotein putative aspartyl protease
MLKNTLLAASLASMLVGIGQARADDALHLRCGGFTYFVGSGAPNPRDYVDIDVSRANSWSVVYTLADGSVHSRNDQYVVGDRSDAQNLVWGGSFNKNPKLYMIGALWIDNQKRVTYTERLFDRSLGDKVVMQQSALCGGNPNKPTPVSAQAPVTAHGGPDVVGLVSNGRAAAVKVYFGDHSTVMMIDTGASSMSLTPEFANELVQAGLAHYTGQSVQVTLANGGQESEREIIVDRVTIGQHTLANVEATITGAGGVMLLPFPVLNQMGKFTIDTRNNLLTFGG